MQSRAPQRPTKPTGEPPSAPGSGTHPTGRPRAPGGPGPASQAPINSLHPFIASLKPSVAPLITFRPDTDPLLSPTALRAIVPPRGPMLGRIAALSSAAVVIAAVSFLAGRHGWVEGKQQPKPTRGAGTPALKTTEVGSQVRWRKDAIGVVLDQSFSEVASPEIFTAAVNAWRATGATLPSISTTQGASKKVGYDPKGTNENVVVYAPFGWAKANGALAITVITYDDATGGIVDADLLVNGGGRYFTTFDHDESGSDDTEVDIESGKSDQQDGTATGKTARYDVQSVLTHELGHFLGLGEDYQESKATMYAKTRPGEIHKRVVTHDETGVISALYAESPPQGSASQGGCGGARLAQGGGPQAHAAWLGVAMGALGLGFLAASRRMSARRVMVRVTSPREARARRLGRAGRWMTAVGLLAFLTPPDLRAAATEKAPLGDADVEIVKAEPRWVDGVLETDLTVRVAACRVSHCPEGEQRVTVAGGSLGGVTQLVGPYPVPAVGARITVGLREPRGVVKVVSSIFQP